MGREKNHGATYEREFGKESSLGTPRTEAKKKDSARRVKGKVPLTETALPQKNTVEKNKKGKGKRERDVLGGRGKQIGLHPIRPKVQTRQTNFKR